MNRLLSIARRAWIPVFLVACAVFLALHAEELLAPGALKHPQRPHAFLGALALQILVWAALAEAWRQVILSRTGILYPLKDALAHFALFSFGKYLPGKVWGATARAINMRRQGVDATDSLEATLHEQFLVLHSAFIVSALLLTVIVPGAMTVILAALATGSAILGGRLIHWLLPALTRLLRRTPRPLRDISPVQSLRNVTLYSMAWLLHGAVLIALHVAFFGETAGMTLHTAGLLILANTIAMVAGFAAIFAPAGIGVREAAMAAVLATGLPIQDAVMLSVAMRAWTVATDVAFGGVALWWKRREG